MAGLCLRLALTWWAEDVQIFINGVLVQSGDLLDYFTRVLLSESATPGAEIIVALRLVSPSHCEGGLMRSVCIYESTTSSRIEPGFVADELDVLQRYLAAFDLDIDMLAEAVSQIDWEVVGDAVLFERSLSTLRQNLQSRVDRTIQSKIHLLGHAHLDMAWLWPVSETWSAAQRTFESVLNLQKDFPDLIFCHSTPALYAWIEEHRPDLFKSIQNQVKSGRWEIVGGMWIEPDLNLIDGESIVRQILYAQRYVETKFNQITKVAWVPDTFGFCATLPQFLIQGGIEYFVTQKLAWNDTTKFPHGAFWWRSPDGTKIFSLMSALIGEGIDPVKMASYAIDWQLKTKLPDTLWLPGVGDHGGGPTRDMLEVAQRWQHSPFFPQLEFTTANAYLLAVSANNSADDQFPIWNDELYLEFHRGCYTTHADQKRWNRRCEKLLYQSELFASLATIAVGAVYPQAELAAAWKKALFNQFHDILPGTSITQVFEEANLAWQEVEQVASNILQGALSAIAKRISLPPPPHPHALPIIIFNPLNWQRSEVVAVPLLAADGQRRAGAEGNLSNIDQDWQVYDGAGQPLPSQLSDRSTLLFIAADIPSVGYRLFWLCPHDVAASNFPVKLDPIRAHLSHYANSIAEKISFANNWTLENEFLRVSVDAETGNIASIFDKSAQREILAGQGNQLQAFKDSGQYWDAWNIDPNYEQHPLPDAELKSIEWIEYGEIQQSLRVVRQIGRSQFTQDYILQTNSPMLKIATTVDWQEQGVLVKAAFPINLTAESATYEIACGAISRPTQPQTATEKAKWEVPAQRWADLTQMGDGEENNQLPIYGVSLLNDCKYGYDSKPNQLRLTLLRSPSWPDPEADRGYHEFTYAIYPHAGSWQSADTVRRGYELNLPLQVMVLQSTLASTEAYLPPVGCFIDLSAQNLILMALKQSEDTPEEWILRCYECWGVSGELSLQGEGGLAIAHEVDLLERSLNIPNTQTGQISPWKIVSVRCRQKNPLV